MAFFSSDRDSDGMLAVWDAKNGNTVAQTPVPAEESNSFRDASPERFLAWSPDNQRLAIVMNRDLHLLNVAEQDLVVLVRHREGEYVVAGRVMGSVKHPAWAVNGAGIVYDAWAPPDVLSEGADDMRDVEYVDVSTGLTELLLENAHVAPQVASGEQELAIGRQDGGLVTLDLTTLEMRETPPPVAQGPRFCDQRGNTCASIASTEELGDLLRLEMLPQGTRVDEVPVTDFGESSSDCRIQSVLWSPDGDTLLATVGCATHVGLWSILIPDLSVSHLVDWTDADSVILLSWFE